MDIKLFPWLAVYVPASILICAVVAAGWGWSVGRRVLALTCVVLGPVLAFVGYVGVFVWFGVFSIENHVK